jgi:hypothetical protein
MKEKVTVALLVALLVVTSFCMGFVSKSVDPSIKQIARIDYEMACMDVKMAILMGYNKGKETKSCENLSKEKIK